MTWRCGRGGNVLKINRFLDNDYKEKLIRGTYNRFRNIRFRNKQVDRTFSELKEDVL